MPRTRTGAIGVVLTAVLTLTFVALLPASAAPPAARAATHHRALRARKHCPRQSVAVRLGRKRHTRVCVHLRSRTRTAATSTTYLFATQRAALRIGPRHHRHAHRLPHALTGPAIGRVGRRMQGVSDGLKGPRLPRLTPEGGSARVSARSTSGPAVHARTTPVHAEKDFSQDGFDGHASLDGSDFEPDAGQTGNLGYDKTIDAHATKRTAKLHHRDHERLQSEACPSVAGEVPGRYEWSRDDETTVPYKGGTGELDQYVGIDTTITGHTTAKGKLRDFDLEATYHTLARGIVRDRSGKVVESDPPNLWTIHLSAHGLHLDDPFKQVADGKANAQIGTVVGPNGAWNGAIPTKDVAVAQDAVLKLALSAMKAGQLLSSLQSAWQDDACIDLDFTSSDLSLSPHLDFNGHPNGGQVTTMKPSQIAHLTGNLKGVRVKKLAPGTFESSVYRSGGSDHGTWTPMSGGFPDKTHVFTYTAPKGAWTKPSDTVTVDVEFFSHQGRALGSLDITPKPTGYRLVYTHASDGDPSFTYSHYGVFDEDGTYTEHQHLGLRATSSMLTPDAHGTATDTGQALTWTAHTWSTDDDNTSTSGQDAGSRCEIDYQDVVTGVRPGTMTVKSLALGPAGADGLPTIKSLDVVFAGVGETWRLTETQKSGPCPGFNSTDDEQIFLNRMSNLYYSGQDGVTEGRYDGSSLELKLDGSAWSSSGSAITRTLHRQLQPDFYNDPPQGAPIPWTDTFRLEPVTQ